MAGQAGRRLQADRARGSRASTPLGRKRYLFDDFTPRVEFRLAEAISLSQQG
jgi:hypothetical protein